MLFIFIVCLSNGVKYMPGATLRLTGPIYSPFSIFLYKMDSAVVPVSWIRVNKDYDVVSVRA